jgi:hypothetical protein
VNVRSLLSRLISWRYGFTAAVTELPYTYLSPKAKREIIAACSSVPLNKFAVTVNSVDCFQYQPVNRTDIFSGTARFELYVYLRGGNYRRSLTVRSIKECQGSQHPFWP